MLSIDIGSLLITKLIQPTKLKYFESSITIITYFNRLNYISKMISHRNKFTSMPNYTEKKHANSFAHLKVNYTAFTYRLINDSSSNLEAYFYPSKYFPNPCEIEMNHGKYDNGN